MDDEKKRERPDLRPNIGGYVLSRRKTKGKKVRRGKLLQREKACFGYKYECGQCGEGFNRIDCLDAHRKLHTGEKPYVCDVCGKGFYRKFVHKRHQMIHTAEKTCKCRFCDKMFIDKDQQASHEITHTGEKPYKCKLCERYFSQSISRNDHENQHTTRKRHDCWMCGMAFKTVKLELSHEKKLTCVIDEFLTNKKFECETCWKKFDRKTYLVAHTRRHRRETIQVFRLWQTVCC